MRLCHSQGQETAGQEASTEKTRWSTRAVASSPHGEAEIQSSRQDKLPLPQRHPHPHPQNWGPCHLMWQKGLGHYNEIQHLEVILDSLGGPSLLAWVPQSGEAFPAVVIGLWKRARKREHGPLWR